MMTIQNKSLPKLSGRVLLVDDDQSVLAMNERMLTEIGCAITACEDAAQALRLFRQDPGAFDIVLTDQDMPAMTGRELAVELLAIRPDLPIILLSGLGEEMTDAPAHPAGIREWLEKPVRLMSLAEVLGRYLRETQPPGGTP